MLTSLWILLCRVGVWLYLATHLYRVKSWLYRKLFEHGVKWYPVQTHRDLDALAATLRKMNWTADGWRQLWDAISYPGAVQARMDSGNFDVGDCDEFAIYIAAVVKKSRIPGVTNPRLLTVVWQEKDGTLGGHNVCLLEFQGAPDDQRHGYMDYGMPRRYASVEGCVQGVLQRYRGETCLGWAISDAETLAPLEVHWK